MMNEKWVLGTLVGAVICWGCQQSPSSGIDYRDWRNLTYFDKPSISGGWVAWGGWDIGDFEPKANVYPIQLYNIPTSGLLALPVSGVSVSISDTTIAYTDFANVFVYSLSDLSEKTLTGQRASGYIVPLFSFLKFSYPILLVTIYGTYPGVIYNFTTTSWEGFSLSNSPIYLDAFPRSVDPKKDVPPGNTTDGRYIVYSDGVSLKFFDSSGVDLTTQTPTPTTIMTSFATAPDISGTTIVWTDYRLGWPNGRIYAYDLTTTTISRVSPVESRQQDPATDGRRVVWTDFRNGPDNPDIYMYDLTTKVETQVTTDPHAQVHASISGDYIVYLDNRLATKSIYLYQISTGTEKRIW